MKFKVKNREVSPSNGKAQFVIGDNADYTAEFEFDSEWNGVVKTARFVRNKVFQEKVLVNDKCEIPIEVLKQGNLEIGVYSAEMSTTPCKVYVKGSIREIGGVTADPTPSVYNQIIEMIEDLQVVGVTDAQIERAVREYLAENPVSGVDGAEVQRIVAEYIELRKDDLKGEKGEKGDKGDKGDSGADGKDGTDGVAGANGADGKSAYDIALDNGFVGTEKEWLESLKGKDGVNGGGSGGTADRIEGKRILCIGDSICEGVGANNQPYPYWLQQWHPNTEIINLGVGGMTIAQKDSSITNAMPVRIANGEFASYKDVDVVVFEGGINDLMNNVKLGYISNGYEPTKCATFCQGMEYMFSYFKGLFPTARMIFVSTHNVMSYDYNKAQAWWGATSEICAKWGVEFLDLFSLICTAKISGLQLHPDYTVHRDYYAKYLDMALASDAPIAGARTSNYYKHNVPVMLQFYSGNKAFEKGKSVSTSDWRINMVRGDLTTYVNVSDKVTYDTTDVDVASEGTYKVHVAYTEDGITLSTDVDVTISGGGGVTKSLNSITATKTKTDFNVGDVVNTDDITVKAHYTDGTEANVTSSANIDTSNANMATAGEYNIAISYSEGGVTKTTQIQITVIAKTEEGGDSGETNEWDDTTTIASAWKTNEGVFSNVTVTEKYTADTTYNVSCKLMVESGSATSGQIILRVGGITSDLGTIAFGEVIDVNSQMKANANWTIGNMQPSVYTTSGSGFPWTVHIKDFKIG